MGIKDMIARCIQRMRAKECATCDNRALCPAGRWQSMFAEFEQPERERPNPFMTFLGELAGAIERGAARKSSFRREVEAVVEPLLASGDANIDRVARELGLSRQTLYRRLKAEGVTFETIARRTPPPPGAQAPARPANAGQAGCLAPRLLRSRGILPRLQALDRHCPQRRSRLTIPPMHRVDATLAGCIQLPML